MNCKKSLRDTSNTPARQLASWIVRQGMARALIFVALMSHGTPTLADSGDYAGSAITQERLQTRRICEDTVKVSVGEDRFNDCVSSLDDSARRMLERRTIETERDACFEKLHARAGGDLSLCLLRAADARPRFGETLSTSNKPDGANDVSGRDSLGSFYVVSNDTKLRRERRACAQIGLDPTFGAFASCVSDLQDALQTQPLD